MSFSVWLSNWTTSKMSWLVLLLTAVGLECAALVFQHIMNYAPCVMCIYQRTAVLGIAFSGLLVLISNNAVSRFVGYLLWIVAAIWGLQLAIEHNDILTATGFFISPCDIEPNFPAFIPLHKWLPSIFAATGFCEDDSWQFLGWNMAKWMIVVFSIYIATFVVVLTNRILRAKRL